MKVRLLVDLRVVEMVEWLVGWMACMKVDRLVGKKADLKVRLWVER